MIPRPVLDNNELAKIWHVNADGDLPGFQCQLIDGRFRVHGAGEALAAAIERVRRECSEAIENGARILILSDRDCDPDHAPIPALLLTSAVHQHLVRTGQRTQVGLVVETGEAREVHHIALLIGYGAAAVNPYLAFESIEDLVASGAIRGVDADTAIHNYIKALSKGVLKVMSKMGISTISSYTGAQVFEALGLAQPLVDEYFGGTPSRLGGVGLDVLADEAAARHATAYPLIPTREGAPPPRRRRRVPVAARGRTAPVQPRDGVPAPARDAAAPLRGVPGVHRQGRGAQPRRAARCAGCSASRSDRAPVPIDEVEPVSRDREAVRDRRDVLRVDLGRGARDARDRDEPPRRQVELAARAARTPSGSRPTRTATCAGRRSSRSRPGASASRRTTWSTPTTSRSRWRRARSPARAGSCRATRSIRGSRAPGTRRRASGLISPPPHHDIYSIEDLAQLIHDLKNANSQARVHVKLVAEVGVGTVAAGVSKCHADVVLISGHDGGTGAAPLTSLKHAGLPWEIGLAETQQTLLLNGLRDRITVQVDGAMKTGRDVVVAALLGAEEYGFSTAPLIVSGCIMMRVCHLDTCPVGVATQNPLLRQRFTGRPEFVVTFFEFVAQQVRELLAELGFRTLQEAIGHVEVLDTAEAIDHWKAAGLDLSPVLAVPQTPYSDALTKVREQDHGLEAALDNTLIQLCEGALLDAAPVQFELPVRNVNRTVGTMLGSLVTRRYGPDGLPPGTIDITFTGSAGQSFGAFVPRGMTLRLVGDANDYVGKGLSGGVLAVRPHDGTDCRREQRHRRQCHRLRRDVRRDLPARRRGGAAVRPQLRRDGGRRGRRRPRARVHDRRHGSDPRSDRPQPRRRHVRRLGVRPRPRRGGRQPRAGGRRRRSVRRVEPAARDRRAHLAYTGSAVAERLLADWPAAVQRFRAIVARDFRRVLEATARAEERGEDVDEAVMAAARS